MMSRRSSLRPSTAARTTLTIRWRCGSVRQFDAAEVDEPDGAVGAEAVVAGVWIGVKQVGVPIGTENEPRDHFRPGVFQLLVGVLCCGPVHSVQIGHGQHLIRDASGTSSGTRMKGCPRYRSLKAVMLAASRR